MKNRITFLFLQGLAAGVVAVLAQDVQGQVIYDNTGTTSSTTTQQGNYTFGTPQAGNEIVVGNGVSKYDITSFAVQFFLTPNVSGTPFSGSPTVTLNLYYNTGPDFGATTYAEPGTSFYSSTFTATAFTPTSGQVLTFTPNVVAQDPDFTWTLTFNNVPAGDSYGLSIFNNSQVNTHGVPVPATGANYNDAWVNSGTPSSPSWSLVQSTTGSNPPNTPGLQFGALVDGSVVPEPSTIALGILGACGFLARRRKS
jgi:hypothetical protein